MLGKNSGAAFTFQVHVDDVHASYHLSTQLIEQLQSISMYQDIVIVCIGTDRSTGDSLGPLIGSSLEKKMLKRMFIYGTLKDPVHAVNLEETLQEIHVRHPNSFILAIDACLGRLKNVGNINFSKGPVIPGAAMKKKLPYVGDMHITGIVNVSGMMEYFVLQNTRLHLVIAMAESIARALATADRKLKTPTVPPVSPPNSSPRTIYNTGTCKTESALSLQKNSPQ
ncbi:spore protease YyaC [Salibacterium salarium]|uniref:Spore protease YyaC n=1 Tax=Salibacterium salarium TaxID=284579 RepID=A0A428MUP3_9BACI|nr:spore protease YyaC [Salibacterium salarium]RSL29806.1 spore protease YyaC [Salibacterium salarium]